jgi:LPXTG-motif cell wall-anchored protein
MRAWSVLRSTLVATIVCLLLAPAGAAAAPLACQAGDLRAVAGVSAGPGHLGNLFVVNQSGQSCQLFGTPGLRLLDGAGAPIAVALRDIRAPAGGHPPAATPVVLAPGGQASAFIGWVDDCTAPAGPYHLEVTLPNAGGTLTIPLTRGTQGSAIPVTRPPACQSPSQPATLEVTPFRASQVALGPAALPSTGGTPPWAVAVGGLGLLLLGVGIRRRSARSGRLP